MGRRLTFEIFRYNPNQPKVKPRMQRYILEETPGMTLFLSLNRIREEQDPSLMFDFVCRAGICGSCGMIANGILRMACRTLTRDLLASIRLMPMPLFKMVGDLSVDTGTWFRQLNQKTKAWIHSNRAFDPDALETPMSNADAANIYEAERCIECGCCVACCATANSRDDFLGAAGLHRIARFMLDPRDERTRQGYFQIFDTHEGTFGCFETMACEDNCPLNLPLDDSIEYVRDNAAKMGKKL